MNCPYCGKDTTETKPLKQLLVHLATQCRVNTDRYGRMPSVGKKRIIAKWQSWYDAVKELIDKQEDE